jgi:hypothetical protein
MYGHERVDKDQLAENLLDNFFETLKGKILQNSGISKFDHGFRKLRQERDRPLRYQNQPSNLREGDEME